MSRRRMPTMLEWWLKMKNARSETHMLHVFADTDDAGVGIDDKRRKVSQRHILFRLKGRLVADM